MFWKYAANLHENTHTKCDFNKIAKQLYWNHTSAWVFSCKFAAYFENIFSYENLWATASEYFSTKGFLKTTLSHISWVLNWSGTESNTKWQFQQLYHTFIESYSNRGQIIIHENNYQWIYHTLFGSCSSHEQTLKLHQFLE